MMTDVQLGMGRPEIPLLVVQSVRDPRRMGLASRSRPPDEPRFRQTTRDLTRRRNRPRDLSLRSGAARNFARRPE
ncbi:hypothetical protein QEN36_19770, partial [Gordonia alkanivorans]